jgi:nitrate/TMAO reductase-like tetraheme cytochrome c subunit
MTMRAIIVMLTLGVAVYTAVGQESPHGAMKTPCESCHTTDSWKMRKDAAFDHARTRFPLVGQHAAIACVACHANLKFAPTRTACAACHTDAHLGELGSDCSRCHTTRTWSLPDMRRRHDETRFPLLGAHASLECEACHKGEPGRRYRGLAVTCIGCHQTTYQQTNTPNHPAAGFSTDCTMCHRATAAVWSGSFDHALTAFPLTGMHASQLCDACHGDKVFKGKSTQCVSCHQSNYTNAVNPNHVAANFPLTCAQCHSTSGWKPASFDHSATKFALTGAHLALACSDCHKNGNYQLVYVDCNGCHATDYAGTTNPNHLALGFPVNCTQCHTTAAWKPASFDHSATKFALTGAHLTISCANCHTSGNYQLVYTDCYACHQTDYAKSTTFPHVSSNLSHQCLSCHTTTAWLPSTFNHDAQFFKIYSGAHRGRWTKCTDCHTTASDLTQFACTACHTASAMNSKHSQVNGYVYANPNCYSCHRNV